MTEQTTRTGKPYQLFRGGMESLAKLNPVDGLDLNSLVECKRGVDANQQDEYFFPVRSQLTWFRLKNPDSPITIQIEKDDEFIAVCVCHIYKAGAREGDLPVQSACGKATADVDGVKGYPLLPTAQSRAISAALEDLGYGCQLDVKTTGGNDIMVGSTPSAAPEGPAPIQPQPDTTEKNEPRPGPDPINPGILVPADRAQADKPPAIPTPPGRRGKKGKAGEQMSLKSRPAGMPGQTTAGEPVTPEAPAAAEQGGAAPDSREVPDDREPNALEDTRRGPEGAGKEDGELPPQPAETPESARQGLSADEQVCAYIEEMAGTPIVQLDPSFFGEGEDDPEGFAKNRRGMETRIPKRDLHRAIEFLRKHEDLIPHIEFPAKKDSALAGKTMSEILLTAPNNIGMLVEMYVQRNAAAYAAAFLLESGVGKAAIQDSTQGK